MTKDEVMEISCMLMDLEDAFYPLDHVKNRYPELNEREEYKNILKAIQMLEKQHDTLWNLIKDKKK